MHPVPPPIAQAGLPEFVPDLISVAGTVVLILIMTAIGGMVYKHLTGGIEWPDDEPAGDDEVRRGEQDEEWEYY